MAQDVSEGSIETAAKSSAPRSRALFTAEAGTRVIYLVLGAVAIALIFWRLQFATPAVCCGDLDGYYHIKWSRLLWEGMRNGHFPPSFTWLPLTTLNPKDYVDHHFLFHILQIPFTWFGDIRLGAKVSAMLFASLAVFSCYWLIVRYRLSYALLWLIALLACSAPFLYRMNMTKAMSVSIVLLIIGIYLLFERKYIWLLPLAFVLTLAYDIWVLLFGAAVTWALVVLWSERRIEWRPVLWVAAGICAGLIINPYFPHNIRLFYEHVLMKVTAGNFKTDVGSEWYPYESWAFLGNCVVAFIAMVVGYIAFDWSDKERAQRPLFFLIFSTVLLIVNARYRRFAEYWPPFAVLFAAFTMQLIFDGVRKSLTSLPPDVLDELKPYLDRNQPTETIKKSQREEFRKTVVAVVVAVLLGVQLFINVRAEVKEISDSAPPDDYRAAMSWIQANIPPGQIIFNTNWDNFPKMFYYDTSHAYVSGLDPTYLHDQNEDLGKLYDQIRLGKEDDPGPIIRDRFGTRYIFTANDDIGNDFYNKALDSGWFEEVYVDKHCTVMRIRDQKGEPPPDENSNNDEGDQGDQGDQGDEPQ